MIHRKNTTLRSILYLLAITLALFAALALVQRQEALAGKLIRLHVVANSNTTSDQAVKLQVRDAVLAAIAPLTDASATQEEAAAALQGNLASIQAAAEAALRQAGQATCSVAVRLCKERFPTRLYPTFSLPAGTYTSLRVELGEAVGRNWWCVVFPPLCVSAAQESGDSATLDDVLDPEQEEIVTEPGKYEVRFKIVEIFEDLCHRISGWFGQPESTPA